MKYVFLLFVLTSCALPQRSNYKTMATRLDECVEKYLKLDLKPEQAIEACKVIHSKE